MTVEFDPKVEGDAGFCFGVGNQTWFWLLNNTGIGKIVNPQNTNDEIDASEEEALACAAVLRGLPIPKPDVWVNNPERTHAMFLEFFETCKGFTTH